MTSALKKVDKAVEDLTTLAHQGKLKTGGNYTFSLKNGGVGLGTVSPKIPKAFVDQTNAIGRQIGAGTIVVKPTIKF
jgi:basic membrane lipoprotein Med (substrate-binding protein (PBP1-ABC) superfamily)